MCHFLTRIYTVQYLYTVYTYKLRIASEYNLVLSGFHFHYMVGEDPPPSNNHTCLEQGIRPCFGQITPPSIKSWIRHWIAICYRCSPNVHQYNDMGYRMMRDLLGTITFTFVTYTSEYV